MPISKKFDDFNALEVPLEGSSLIEASAGTGKTYSIAILVLRLLLEKRLSVKEILMVTFTKAAVAELEERIRLFVRTAYKASQGDVVHDETIIRLVNRATGTIGVGETEALLKEAVLFLDETSVLTIHGFCQLTLTEFAFETGQLFGSDTLQDTSALLTDQVNRFWRRYITTIPEELLGFLTAEGLSRESIAAIVKEHLDGKRYVHYDESADHHLCDEDHLSFARDIRGLKEKEQQLNDSLVQYITSGSVRLKEITETNTHARKALLHLIDTPVKFKEEVWKKRTTGYIAKLYNDVLEQCDTCQVAATEVSRLVQQVISKLYCLAINKISAGVDEHKRRNNQLSFDDMIINLHKALIRKPNPRLAERLQEKYKAVFIDEFQDTDKLQYEIFSQAFGPETIVFYIGDPKQSIYAWRKADIFTYFKASDAVDRLYGMNTNYRSANGLIAAMNRFFKPLPRFDTFHFEGASHAIEYIDVSPPAKDTKGVLLKNGEADIPLTVCTLKSKKAITEAVAAQVAALLGAADYSIPWSGAVRKVRPADIGILVRSNYEARDVKSALAVYGIPAVTIGDQKVLQSDEAVSMLYLLEAMDAPSLSTINRALLSPFTGYTTSQLLRLDDEQAVEVFRKYKTTWLEYGIYTALTGFITDFNVQRVLTGRPAENGERTITNLLQLTELLHKVQTRKKLSPPELISWLKRATEGMETEGDEYEQRIESDEESVKIVTIHKSKGLEYQIVLAPFLDFRTDSRQPLCSFRDAETGEYIFAGKTDLSDRQQELLVRQLEQENRRLLYVAITRAVYKCFIYRNTHFRQSTLSVFTDALQAAPGPFIEFIDPPEAPAGYLYAQISPAYTVSAAKPVQFSLLEQNWIRMSYSRLRAQHTTARLMRSANPSGQYDRFVFTELPRGAKTGNLLHYIFENIRFENNSNHDFVIEAAVRRFAPGKGGMYTEMLREMLGHLLETEITPETSSPFRLADIGSGKQLHEFEFDFTLPLFKAPLLESLSGNGKEIHIGKIYEIEGLMNGKMDLFFEHQGRYYILDWKSNYLGDTLNDYASASVAAAMNENNYHLQYLIYTLAAKKYLESRLPDFNYDIHFGGVFYFFVRGIRKGSGNGIFTSRPPAGEIERLNDMLNGNEIVTA